MMCGIRDVVPAVPSDSCYIFAGDLLGKDKAGVFLFSIVVCVIG